jgi:hypothetical protein
MEEFAYLGVEERADAPAPPPLANGRTVLTAVFAGHAHVLLPHETFPLVVRRDERLLTAGLVVVVPRPDRERFRGTLALVKSARHDDADRTVVVVRGLRLCLIHNLLRNGRELLATVDPDAFLDAEPAVPPPLHSAFLPFQVALFDGRALRDKVVRLLEAMPWFAHVLVLARPVRDPDQFSFIVGSRVCFNEDREELLMHWGTSARLRFLIRVLQSLQQRQVIVCDACRQPLSSLNQLLALSQQEFHVNEHGALHSLMTVSSALMERLVRQGEPSSDHSYFRNYAWTILECACGNHVGWLYSSYRGSPVPSSFMAFRAIESTW